MRWFVIGCVVVVSLAALVVAVGFLLPATRSGTSERVIAAPPDTVRAVIDDVASQPEWRPGVASVELSGAGWTERTDRGEAISFRRIAATETRIELGFDSDRGYRGTWIGELAAAEGGTRLTVTETATTPSPLGRILSRLFFDPRAFAEAYLDALQVEAERRGAQG